MAPMSLSDRLKLAATNQHASTTATSSSSSSDKSSEADSSASPASAGTHASATTLTQRPNSEPSDPAPAATSRASLEGSLPSFHLPALPSLNLSSSFSGFGRRAPAAAAGKPAVLAPKSASSQQPQTSSDVASPVAQTSAGERASTPLAHFALGTPDDSRAPSPGIKPTVGEVKGDRDPLLVPLPPSPRHVALPLPSPAEDRALAGVEESESEPEPEPEPEAKEEEVADRDASSAAAIPGESPLETARDGAPATTTTELKDARALQERVRELEAKVSQLESRESQASAILRELTPLEGIGDPEGLRDHLSNISSKAEMTLKEIKRLNGQIELQEGRIEELRETHGLESKSRSTELETNRSAFISAKASLASMTTERDALKQEVTSLKVDVTKAKASAKEEEEKRTKAISLLKTVRQKLVKADQVKDEALADREAMRLAVIAKESEAKAEGDKIRADLERVKAEREKDVRGLREKFEVEVKGLRTGFERENKARREEAELKAVTIAATHAKEIQVLRGRISTLQTTADDLTTQKTSLFDQLQARQAELELATSEKSAVSLQLSEAQFQLRETSERASSLEEELADARRRASAPATSLNGASPASSAETSVATSRQLASAALAYESKLSDLRTRISRLETERAEAEEEWSRNVQERTKEVERLRRVTDDKDREYEEAVRSRRAREERVYDLEKERETLAKEVERERRKGEEGWERMRKVADEEAAAREEIKDLATKISSLETSLAESKTQLQTLRQSSRTLKEELRKVQSSALLLEKQRNPGVGYWSQRNGSISEEINTESVTSPMGGSKTPSEAGTVAASPAPEEEVNLEYLRNVIIQFLEHKEMRANLVRVLSVILHFTPQETRRLVAGVS